ncbi:MAG: flagellar biosynthesis anti-sigma factor FlgM [Candidatus Aminicenantes bacterium]|nr:MAG: flagellar biosynthesis anti-sigma factor FlgM [Candidatus Aminicenantes bacterium]
MKTANDNIDKFNSEWIQPDLKHMKQNEKASTNIAYDDKVVSSSQALDLKEMQTKTISFPDVRSEKVKQIKKQVKKGTYKISTEKIAEFLIEEAMEVNA